MCFFVCQFVCLFGSYTPSSRLAFPNVPIHFWHTHTQTPAHTLTLYPANLQPSESTDCVCSNVQLATLQSTTEHIPSLCFLYRPIKIFPLIASLLQVGEREKWYVWIMNSHLPLVSLPSTWEMLYLFSLCVCVSQTSFRLKLHLIFWGSKADNPWIEIWFCKDNAKRKDRQR